MEQAVSLRPKPQPQILQNGKRPPRDHGFAPYDPMESSKYVKEDRKQQLFVFLEKMDDKKEHARIEAESTQEINKVSIKIPPFWTDKPEIWFYQVEAQFNINAITSEETEFNYLIAQLEPKYIENVWDIITLDSKFKYTESKTRLLNIFKDSESVRIKNLSQE
ncbi:hypothetical protein LAZ67_3004543 [Cordylochernes scorpioides]|uniref:DUF7041 domain-containing protein n=1 Tax=Cordylochernes scorpioides TaxID=51811 RepID=A0ABY6KB97_9ARAC|nr:hypothetical protein LAZ67_3004543 [Cordylochernes scorpioides]